MVDDVPDWKIGWFLGPILVFRVISLTCMDMSFALRKFRAFFVFAPKAPLSSGIWSDFAKLQKILKYRFILGRTFHPSSSDVVWAWPSLTLKTQHHFKKTKVYHVYSGWSWRKKVIILKKTPNLYVKNGGLFLTQLYILKKKGHHFSQLNHDVRIGPI